METKSNYQAPGAHTEKACLTTGTVLVYNCTVLNHIRQVERHTKCYDFLQI